MRCLFEPSGSMTHIIPSYDGVSRSKVQTLPYRAVESADKETMILGWNAVGGHTAPDE